MRASGGVRSDVGLRQCLHEVHGRTDDRPVRHGDGVEAWSIVRFGEHWPRRRGAGCARRGSEDPPHHGRTVGRDRGQDPLQGEARPLQVPPSAAHERHRRCVHEAPRKVVHQVRAPGHLASAAGQGLRVRRMKLLVGAKRRRAPVGREASRAVPGFGGVRAETQFPCLGGGHAHRQVDEGVGLVRRALTPRGGPGTRRQRGQPHPNDRVQHWRRCSVTSVVLRTGRPLGRGGLLVSPLVLRVEQLRLGEHDEPPIGREEGRALHDRQGQPDNRIVYDHRGGGVGHGVPREQRVEASLVRLRSGGTSRPLRPMESGARDDKGAGVGVHGQAHRSDHVDRERAQVEDELGVQARRRADVEHRVGGNPMCVRLAPLAVRPPHLADESQHGGEVVWLQREGLVARAPVCRRVERV